MEGNEVTKDAHNTDRQGLRKGEGKGNEERIILVKYEKDLICFLTEFR